MARARTPHLAGIKTQCSRFDALRRFQPLPGAIRWQKLRPSRAGSLILYRSERPLFPALTSRIISSPMRWALAENVIIFIPSRCGSKTTSGLIQRSHCAAGPGASKSAISSAVRPALATQHWRRRARTAGVDVELPLRIGTADVAVGGIRVIRDDRHGGCSPQTAGKRFAFTLRAGSRRDKRAATAYR
jgi:hypothetical protein